MNKIASVEPSVANLYKAPSFQSELVTQAFERERLLILDQNKNWYKVRQWDNYESWIHSFYIGDIEESKDEPDYRWGRNRATARRWFSNKRLINEAKFYLDVPYLWGGKSEFGFDCSGFVQTVFYNFIVRLPRDSHQQMNHEGLVEIKYSEAQVGDLLFFSDDNKNVNHVAISIGNGEIIHSSGYVKIEKLEENKELYKKLYKVMSIRKLEKIILGLKESKRWNR